MSLNKWSVQSNGDNDGSLIPVYTISQYLRQENQLSIPPWQREYTWDSSSDDGEVSQLMDDLVAFVASGDDEYLIGAVILCDTADPKIKYIIDGQQRSVTLTLFLMCAFKHLTQELNDHTDHNLLVELESCFNRGSHFNPSPSVIFSQKRADKVMQEIRAWMILNGDEADKRLKEIDTYSTTQKNLLAVVRYFSRGLAQQVWFSDADLKNALWKIIQHVRVLQLNLNNQREAIRVYDRINNRGRHLSGGDLVKNLMFEQVNDDKFDEINENWTSVVETLRKLGSSKTQEPTFLLRSLAWGMRHGKTTYDELPQFFIDHFKEVDSDGNKVDPIKFSASLLDSAEALAGFEQLSHRKHGSLPMLQIPQWLGTVQHYAILLAGEKIQSKEAFLELYRQVATRTMMYLFAQERTPDFETLVNTWAHKVYSAGPAVSVDEIKQIFHDHVGYPGGMIDQLRTNAMSWTNLKSAEKKRIRASLALMSWWLDGECKEDNGAIVEYFRTRKRKGDKYGWDVDHIEAQKSDALGLTDETKNRFGNLVLLHPSDNRGAKNATASSKEAIYEHSKIILTKSLVAGNFPARLKSKIDYVRTKCGSIEDKPVTEWGETAIELRTEFYARFLVAIITRTI
jgi:hypothetical protein